MCVYRCVAPPLCGKSLTFAASTKESANISNTTEQRLGIRVFGNPPFEKIKRASVKSAHLQQRVLCSRGFKSLQLPVNCVLHLRKNTKDLGSSKPRKSLMQPAFEPTASFLVRKGGTGVGLLAGDELFDLIDGDVQLAARTPFSHLCGRMRSQMAGNGFSFLMSSSATA